MNQGGVIAPTMMASELFRKKLRPNTTSRGPARCLFGIPDVTIAKQMVQKVEAVQAWSFSKRWNFDITGKPNPPVVLESRTNPQPKYEWNKSYDGNYMAKCDRHRFEAPIVPNTRAVPLFFASTMEPLVPEILVKPSVSVQTETESQVHQSTQAPPPEEVVETRKRTNCELTLSLFSFAVSTSDTTTTTDEQIECPPIKRERRLPVPLTIPPISPDQSMEEIDDDDDDHADDTFSPVPEKPTYSENSLQTPIKRRNSIGVFTFSQFGDSPSNSMKCLTIRHVSPIRSHSACKSFTQRSITDYMQVKKTMQTLSSPKSNKNKKFQ